VVPGCPSSEPVAVTSNKPMGTPNGTSEQPKTAPIPEGVQGTRIGFQMPEKSGVLPSAILGACALRSAFPSGPRGTRLVFTSCHWADKGSVANARAPETKFLVMDRASN
jgi:hypothetical protein